MELFEVKVYHKRSIYDYLFIDYSIVLRIINNFVDNHQKDVFASGDYTINARTIILRINGIFAHYFVKELTISKNYRCNFIKTLERLNVNRLVIKLIPANKEIIDYKCNEILNYMVWERLELDHALSWLSTLGGAFSALGDYFPNAALMAGKISQHQFKLALRLGDPNIQSRCRLFLSLSLIQQRYLRIAKKIVQHEYKIAKNDRNVDIRLVKMCLGIWAKLKYEWNQRKR